ncbi:triokinase/FMN cyclase-like [Dendronephthya gigantea]|uniref:triokinase/FMN cyclase-like n=1 Tax=Dendronephthya gigantea TaxID=151771 RepID=UPI00106C2E74|nr:triokinase/FMN cyclase-like [Dendronephthya gigantea]
MSTKTHVETRSKKIINNPYAVVDEALNGAVLSNNDVQLLNGHRVLIRRDVDCVRERSLVALISGGGSGHEPAHAGFVGHGGLTAAVAGDVFTSPPTRSVLATIRAVGASNEGGVLLIVKNYTGDRLNFGMAAERAKQEGIKVDIVVVNEDCALASVDKTSGRRGLCGTVIIHKIAGAMAETGASLEEMVPFLQDTIKNMGTMGVSLSPCSIPGSQPSFHLADDEIELGLGIHGEKGVERIKLLTAKQLVQRMVEHMSTESEAETNKFYLKKGDKLGLMVNNLGGTTQLELYIVAKEAVQYLKTKKGVEVERIYVGTFMTSLEMAGVSITLLHLNEDRKKYLDFETRIPGWPRVFGDQNTPNPLEGYEPVNRESGDDMKVKGQALTSGGRKLYNCLLKIAETLEANEERLNNLDRLAGDGDCGSTLKRAAIGIKDTLGNIESCGIPCNTPYQALIVLSDIIEDRMGGSSGALYSLFLLAGVEQIKDNVEPMQWCKAFECGIQAIMRYGGAQEGYRTMLDAMCPAVLELKKGLKNSDKPLESFQKAVKAAEDGAQNTAKMQAQAGRASYIGSSILSEPDPGAVAVALWMNAICAALK